VRSRRTLVALLPGLGDALCASPAIRAAAALGEVDALTMLGSVRDYATATGVFARVVQLPLLDRPAKAASLLWTRGRYARVVVPFPATRWQYALVAAAAGGSLVIHDYGGLSRAIAAAVPHTLVPLRGGHRLSENARLAAALGARDDDRTYLIPAQWRAPREANLVGFHTGSMRYKGNDAKRWPIEAFAAVAARLRERGARIRAFFGPDEEDDADVFRATGEVEIVQLPLSEAARAIAACSAFVANDSGLAHLAGGLGVPTVVVYGMTSAVRGLPIGPAVAIVPTTACAPCHDEGARTFDCPLGLDHRCIRHDVAVGPVVAAALRALEGRLDDAQPVETSPYRLYGRSFGAA
jgi:ADP-heptose:LPS heptosyltransferase